MSGFVPLKTNGQLFRPRNVNVNLWGKEGLPNTLGKGNKVLVNFLNKRAYPETQQTMLFLTPPRS